jgi:hypothetical protein
MLHDKIDPQNSIKTVDVPEDTAWELVMASADDIRERLRRFEHVLEEAERQHSHQLQELRN